MEVFFVSATVKENQANEILSLSESFKLVLRVTYPLSFSRKLLINQKSLLAFWHI